MNVVALIGRLTKDPELKTTSTGKRYVRFTLAVNRFNDQADFISCIAWDKTAEAINNYTRKGRRISVQGSLNVSSFKTQTGETRWSTDVVANRVEFLESISGQSNSDYSSGDDYEKPASKSFMDESIEESYDEGDFPF